MKSPGARGVVVSDAFKRGKEDQLLKVCKVTGILKKAIDRWKKAEKEDSIDEVKNPFDTKK
jgi:hypothetical protein